jgi:hypothetical protein
MDTWIKASTCTAILLAGSGVFYHYVVFLPGLERARAAESRPVGAMQADLDQCRQTARLHYDLNWASACLSVGDPSSDCSLPDARAALVNAAYQESEQRCIAEARARK